MVKWIFVLFAVTLSLSTIQLAAFSIRADAEDHADEEVSPGKSRERREIELGKHNCLEEVKYEFLYKYLDEKADDNNFELIAQSPYLRQLINVTQCRVLPPPLTNDSNEQCFQSLYINNFGLKSYCETMKTKSTIYFYNKDQTVMYRKVIKVPVACGCMVSHASEAYS